MSVKNVKHKTEKSTLLTSSVTSDAPHQAHRTVHVIANVA